MEDLVNTQHKQQTRNNGKVPYVTHLYGVRSVLESLIESCGEITDATLAKDLGNAALGHDLLEDTHVTKEEITANSNSRTLALIEELTNPEDDAHTEKYMNQLHTASEEARLVKYADLIDNTLSVAYGLHDLGRDWIKDFYLPILENTQKILADTNFTKYPKTAEEACRILKLAVELLSAKLTKVN